MHEYLRAVGFAKIKEKEELDRILHLVEESYQTEKTAVNAEGMDFSERRKEFAPRIGLMLRGEYDRNGNYRSDYYVPYFRGKEEKRYDEISVERHAEKESYAAVCDDYDIAMTLIFYVQNVTDYLSERRSGRYSCISGTVKLSGLSTYGRILLPVEQKVSEEENADAILQRTKLIKAAREGDEEAMENLTIDDMDTYSMISRRIADEDVFSIVATYFMPCGVECDHYNVMGEILELGEVKNGFTGETLYLMKLECRDLILEVCINKEDLLGEPLVGRRFKGVIWLQGQIVFDA